MLVNALIMAQKVGVLVCFLLTLSEGQIHKSSLLYVYRNLLGILESTGNRVSPGAVGLVSDNWRELYPLSSL